MPLLDGALDVLDFFTGNRANESYDYTKPNAESTGVGAVVGSLIGGQPLLGAAIGAISSTDWGKDIWNYLGRKMNDFQIDDYKGYIQRANVLNYLIDQEKRATELERQLQDIDSILSGNNPELDYSTFNVSELKNRRTQITNELNELKEDRIALQSYKPNKSSDVFNTVHQFLKPLNIITDNFIFGKTTKTRDELVDISKGLRNYNLADSFEDRMKVLNDMQKTYEDKLSEWNHGIDENIVDKESYGRVSDFFQYHADNTRINFFSPDTYLFGMPGLIAGSVSSMNKQIPAMITGYGSGAALGAGFSTGDPGALAGGVAGSLGTYWLNYTSGISENNAEVAEAFDQKFKARLKNNGLYDKLIEEGRKKLPESDKLSDDDIIDKFERGLFVTNNRKIQEQVYKSALGIESAFQDDMAATTWDALIDTALEIVPLGSGVKGVKTAIQGFIKGSSKTSKFIESAINNPTAKKIINSRLGKTVLEEAGVGFKRGSVISPLAAAINTPLHLALSPIEKYSGNFIRQQVAKRLGWTAGALQFVPDETLTKVLSNSTRNRYMRDIAGRMIAVSVSEGIEEGKQGIVQRRMENDYYNSNIVKSIWDTAVDDMLAGSKSAGLILGMPFGLVPQEDEDLLNEIKGGMLMGMFSHGTAINILSNVAPYIKEQKANQFFVENFLNNKFDTLTRFKKSIAYAEKSKDNVAYNAVLDAFERFNQINNKQKESTGLPLVDTNILNDEIKYFKEVAQEARNLYTVKQAEAQGIKPGTSEYNEFVAAKTLAQHLEREARAQHNSDKNALDNGIAEIQASFLEKHFSHAMPGHEEQQEPADPSNINFGSTDQIAHHTALLKRKQELELGILNAKSRNKTQTENKLNSLLDNVKFQLAFSEQLLKSTISTNDVDLNDVQDIENKLVFDRDQYDNLSQLYRNYIQSLDDLNLVVQDLNDVTGKIQIKDGEEWRDLTDDDYADPESDNNDGKFDPSKDIDKVRFVEGKAKDVLKKFKDLEESDNNLEERFQEEHQKELNDTVKAVEVGAVDTKGNIIDDEKLQQVQSGEIEQTDPVEEFKQEVTQKSTPVEEQQPIYQQPKVQEEKPLIHDEQKQKERPVDKLKVEVGSEYGKNNKVVTQEDYNNLIDEWRKLNNRLNSGIVGTIQLGAVMSRMAAFHIEAGVRKFVDFAKRMIEDLGEDVKPYLVSAYLGAKYLPGMEEYAKEMDNEAFVKSVNLDDLYNTPVDNKRQQDTINALRTKAEESKKYVIDVTPDYYLIKVGDQEIKMDRVHSVMPKSWVEGDNANASVQASLQVGGAFDTLARIFFSNKNNLRRFEENPSGLISELAKENVERFKDKKKRVLNTTFGELYSSEDDLKQTVSDLYYVGRQYERLGWELVTDPIVWYNKFNRGYVAGETDMLAVDKSGNIHIIDFKTAKGRVPFERFLWNRPELTLKFKEDLSKLDKSDFTVGNRGKGLSKRAIKLKHDINKAQKSNSIVLTWNDLLGVAEINYINSNFYSTNGSRFRLRPKSQEYSDQLTAYSEMIQANLFNVVDLEILGFRTSYSVDYDKLIVSKISELTNLANGKPLRIKLSLSDDMNGILNNEGHSDQIETENNDKQDSEDEQQVAISTQTDEQLKNDEYKPPVDGTTLATPEEPELNKVNVKRKDHNGALDHTSLDYVRISKDKRFTDDTNAYDFITWCLQNSAVELYTEEVKGVRYLYADINYKGHEYKRVYVQTHNRDIITDAGKYLLDRVIQLEKTKKPGQKIVAVSMNRTSGQIGIRPDKKYVSITEAGLVSEINLSDVEFSTTDKRFGFVKNGDVISFVNGNDKQQQSIYTFSGRNILIPANGTFVFIKSTNHQEKSVQQQMPIVLERAKLSDNFNFIIDCLRNIDLLDKPYVFTQNGQQIRINVTRRQLLNLLIPYADNLSDTENILSIVRDPVSPSVFSITAKNRTQPVVTVNILDQKSIDDFRTALQNISVVEQHRMLGARLGDDSQSAMPVFAGIRKFFADKNNTIKSLNISNNLKFDFEDFVSVPSTKTPNKQNDGLTGFGWAIKNGWFTTQYGGMQASNVEIEEVALITPESNNIDLNQPQAVEETANVVNVDQDQLMDLMGFALDKRETEFDVNKPKLTKEQIKERLRPILGKMVDNTNLFKLMDVPYDESNPKAKIVGKASADAITIYSAAFAGVDYHEAFHRIFELYVPEKTRNLIYEKTAKNIGVDLKNSTEKNNFFEHRQVAENIADKYMDYKSGQITRFNPILNRVFNTIRDVINLFRHFDELSLYWIFLKTNLGVYKKAKVSDSAKKRFNTLFKELNYEIHGTEFNHILNDVMYEDVKDTAVYLLSIGQHIELSGANVQEIKISPDILKAGAEKLKKYGFDIFGKEGERTVGQAAMQEVLDKFYAVSDDLAARFANISTDYVKKFENEEREKLDGDEESIKSANYEEQIKASYEFSKFDKSSSRVKFFFSLMPQLEYTESGKIRYVTNSLGMPKLIPMNYVFNEVLISLWDVDTIDELLNRLTDLSKDNPMFQMIKGNISRIVAGRVVDGKVDADKEALLVQLMSTIRSNRHTFMIARSERAGDKYNILLETSDADYNAKFYPSQWSQVLSKGGTDVLKVDKYGRLVFNPKNKYASQLFTRIGKFFDSSQKVGDKFEVGLKQILSDYGLQENSGYQMTVKVIDHENSNGETLVRKSYTITNPKDQVQCNILKDKIVEALNSVGIRMSSDEFNFMLRHKYGSADWEALQLMVNSTDDKDSMSSFIRFLNTISTNGRLNIDKEGNVLGMRNRRGNPVKFDNVYSEMAFIKELGNWKWAYRKAHDQLTVLALDGNRYYEMSDNDYISDVLRGLNKRDRQFEELKEDSYNYFIGERDALGKQHVEGSITLKQLTQNPDLKLLLRHFIGFKTDKKGDQGSDYFEISKQEDYLSKVTILENGGLIMLTLSDKKKYCYLDGVVLPGINYKLLNDLDSETRKEAFDKLSEKIIFRPNKSANYYGVQQNEDIINQMISYAKCEYESVKKAGLKIEELKRQGRLDQDVVNYYTLQQGARFSSLLGVWENTYDKDGNVDGEQFISFNDGRHDWHDDLRMAEIHFFDRPLQEQQALIARNLQRCLDKELSTALELGLIKKNNTSNPYLGYQNIGLNNKYIDAIQKSYMQRYPSMKQEDAHSIAVVMYMSDISAKAIMSGQEIERLFSGNPAFYKWKYDSKGNLVDRTVDELKRLGGIGSTGTNNFLELENIPEKYLKDGVFTGKYVQAEVDNEMVSSPQIEDIRKLVYEGQLKYNAYLYDESERLKQIEGSHIETIKYIRKEFRDNKEELDKNIQDEEARYREEIDQMRKDLADSIYMSSTEDIESRYPNVVSMSKINANEVSEAYAKNIDVADGGAYITDQMCEMLLRMVGSYSKEVENAFDILRGRVKSNYLQQADAYQKVLTTVIGNQKYTAFGRRLQDGVSVPYYNKMALFPIFECIATGKMKNIFDKMKQQGIDVLAVNSAVKVGSQGSKDVKWSDFREDNDPTNENNFIGDIGQQNWKPVFEESFNFNTYEQDFKYLRKQLNTDPTEEQLMRMGTQMQKVVFSNLIQGKTYIGQDGSKITGLELQNRIMSSLNSLSDLGVDKLNKKFFKVNEEGQPINIRGEVVDRNSSERVLDTKKFADEVSKMMSEKGADKNVLKALEYVRNNNIDAVPLGAISNSGWIESSLISAINKEIIDVNTPGSFFIQRSIWAMEGTQMLDRSKGQIKGVTLYNGKELLMHNNKNSMDCVLSLDFFDHILPKIPLRDSENRIVYKVNDDGSFVLNNDGNRVPVITKMSFEDARKWLIDHNIIGENANPNIVGYRIPTQAESSIHALRCVDVLPVVRDTVILPKEFTKITGSDFDIDKLGLSWFNYNKDGSINFEEGSEEYYQNQILQSFITFLTDTDTVHILQRSIDNDTKLLKDVISELEQKSEQREEPYLFYQLSTQVERKNDYITGKLGIGPFALNNNNHILTTLYGVKFNKIEGTIITELGLTDLSKREDVDHKSILSWISALINAHVDIAKDPYISKLNVNQFTYDLVNTLIRTGFGKNTFYFTTQPIMKELAKAYINAQSAYMADPNKTQFTLQREAIEETAKSHFIEESLPFIKDATFDDWNTSAFEVGYRDYITEAFKQITEDGSLFTNANVSFDNTKGTTITIGDDKYELTGNQVQYIMYLAFLQMEPYAKSVSNLVKYSKIDTKKQGNNYIEQQLYKQAFNDLFYGDQVGMLFDQKTLQNMANGSYLATKTINAINMTQDILKGHFLQATAGFNNAKNIMLNLIGRGGSKDLKLNNKVCQAIMAAIKSQFINDYAKRTNKNNPTYIRDLVSESFEENLEYEMEQGSNEMLLSNDMKYKPSSYIGGMVTLSFISKRNDDLKVNQKLANGGYISAIQNIDDNTSEYMFTYPIVGANDDNNSIIVPFKRDSGKMQGKIVKMIGGKNTIYDRFNDLIISLKDNPDYFDVIDESGEPTNILLRSLIPGRTYEYKKPSVVPEIFTEEPDTYSNLKFIKLFNALDNNSAESDYIIDAWDQLLHDQKHPVLQKFAEDLVVYAFVTSGDKGGFTKFFKQVPLSWRKESGYGSHIQDWINNLTVGDIDIEMLEDAVLNNWFDNDFVRTYYTVDKDKIPQFITYSGTINTGVVYRDQISFPLIMAALKTNKEGKLEASINPDEAPLFIKTPRTINNNTKEGQRAYTVYRLQDIAMRLNSQGEWVRYPVYVKVNPKGIELPGNYLMTEYGRDDSVRDERIANVESLEGTYKVNDFISKQDLEQYRVNFSEAYSRTIEDLNFGYLRNKLGREFDKKLTQFNNTRTISNNRNNAYTQITAAWWSSLEGWSEEYFYDKVLPRINEAWQMEYKIAEDQSAEPKFKGQMTFKYGKYKRPDINADTTFEAIKSGERTSTTRYESDGHIDYWKNAKVGDIIEFTNGNESIKVEVTKPLTKIGDPREQIDQETQQEIEQTVQNTPNYYEGQIVPDANTVFVFGSNPEGRHGAGAAKVAREQFGAIYGQGEGLQGNSYAIPTKDLRVKENNSYRSISPQQIVENIKKMYEVAKQNPDKTFKIAYKPGPKLNGYTDEELISMFKSAGEIPSNVQFSKGWIDMWNDVIETPEWQYAEESWKSDTELTEEELKEAEEYKKLCEGE